MQDCCLSEDDTAYDSLTPAGVAARAGIHFFQIERRILAVCAEIYDKGNNRYKTVSFPETTAAFRAETEAY